MSINGKSRKNGQISRHIWPTKIEPKGYKNLYKPIIRNEFEVRKSQDQMGSQLNSASLLKKN
jgi:hypothetical protein